MDNSALNNQASFQLKISCLLLIIFAMLIASIDLPYPKAYVLHQTGTVVFIIGILILERLIRFRGISWIMVTVFLLLHIVGARYIYSFVPYNEWIQSLFAINLHEVFGWDRNMYDRLVHFAFGLCLFPMMVDGCKKFFQPPPIKLLLSKTLPGKPLLIKQIIIIVLLFNMSCSMLYELFEWGLTILMSPENAESYNGQQGDMWDAHKDMGLALLGAVLAIPFSLFDKD